MHLKKQVLKKCSKKDKYTQSLLITQKVPNLPEFNNSNTKQYYKQLNNNNEDK